MWLHSLKVAQLLRSAAFLHTNQSRTYLNLLVVVVVVSTAVLEVIVVVVVAVAVAVGTVVSRETTNHTRYFIVTLKTANSLFVHEIVSNIQFP